MSSTVIGPGITVDGEVSGDEPLVVQGKVKGNVTIQEAVHVEPGGFVEATVQGTNVIVSGTLRGEVEASEKIEVKQGGKMLGNVKAPRILIADGALFKGSIDMDVE